MARKLILVELNEVPGRIVDEFRLRYPRSTLARLRPSLVEYETLAEDRGHLSPWVTWPTLHRGVDNDRHAIAAFGQDLAEANREFPNVWELALRGGRDVGVCGSLHSYAEIADMERYAFFVPDTFAAGSECFPKRLSAFQEFNLAMARESARNVSKEMMWKSAARLLLNAPQLGLRLGTLADIGRQVIHERIRPERVVRRRTYQGLLAFDVFYKQLRRTRPALATFFTNHVAAAMHRYWAARFPADYDEFGFDGAWVRTYGDEIDFAMRKFDRCLSDLVSFAKCNADYQVWIATSMGQAPTTAQPQKSQLVLTDPARLLAALDVPGDAWHRQPAMVPQVNLTVDEPHADRLRARLTTVTINGRPLDFYDGDGGFFCLTVTAANPDPKTLQVEIAGQCFDAAALGMSIVANGDQVGLTAYHVPEGLLLMYDPRRAPQKPFAKRPQISTLDIAPLMLRYLDVAVPSYMRQPRDLMAA